MQPPLMELHRLLNIISLSGEIRLENCVYRFIAFFADCELKSEPGVKPTYRLRFYLLSDGVQSDFWLLNLLIKKFTIVLVPFQPAADYVLFIEIQLYLSQNH